MVLLETSGGFWRLLEASGGFWWLLEASGGFWHGSEAKIIEKAFGIKGKTEL